jgi:hypothetical protein
MIITEVAIYQAIEDDYEKYAQKLRQIAPTDPILRNAAEGIGALAIRYRVLDSARPDECEVLQRWRIAR